MLQDDGGQSFKNSHGVQTDATEYNLPQGRSTADSSCLGLVKWPVTTFLWNFEDKK